MFPDFRFASQLNFIINLMKIYEYSCYYYYWYYYVYYYYYFCRCYLNVIFIIIIILNLINFNAAIRNYYFGFPDWKTKIFRNATNYWNFKRFSKFNLISSLLRKKLNRNYVISFKKYLLSNYTSNTIKITTTNLQKYVSFYLKFENIVDLSFKFIPITAICFIIAFLMAIMMKRVNINYY
jgi:hypothetical protein